MPTDNNNPLSHLGFQRFLPSEKLSSIVDCYWFINREDSFESTEHLHPDGGLGIILNYGSELQFDANLNSDRCILDGTTTLTRKLKLMGSLNAIGIRFKPAGASLLFSLPLNVLKNETISLQETPLKHMDLYYKLSKAQTFHSKILIIEQWLFRSLQTEKNISNVVAESLMLIKKHKGLLPIGSVAKRLDYHPRRIERLFNSQVGMTPKEFSRNLRIEQARSYLKLVKNNSFATIAHDLGYYDQAHFINQFKNIEGITPREYLIKSSLKNLV